MTLNSRQTRTRQAIPGRRGVATGASVSLGQAWKRSSAASSSDELQDRIKRARKLSDTFAKRAGKSA